MTEAINDFIKKIDEADEELIISTDRAKHQTTARNKRGKLYYYINYS